MSFGSVSMSPPPLPSTTKSLNLCWLCVYLTDNILHDYVSSMFPHNNMHSVRAGTLCVLFVAVSGHPESALYLGRGPTGPSLPGTVLVLNFVSQEALNSRKP